MAEREGLAHLRRYADAVSTLAEMAMVSHHGLRERRFVAYYDDNEEEWVVQRQWRGERDDHHREDDLARAPQFWDAVEAAYERWAGEGKT